MFLRSKNARYRTVSAGTLGAEQDLKVTEEGNSMTGEGNRDDNIPIFDGGYSQETCRGSSKNVKFKTQRKKVKERRKYKERSRRE